MNDMEMYHELRTEHDALTEAARPLVAKHLALAFYKEGDILAEHVRLAKDHRLAYLKHHAASIPRTEDAFNDWEGKGSVCNATILDTMMNVQNEMLGADDSRADYMPDGLRQAQLLTDDSYDSNGFLWYCINNLSRTIYPAQDDSVDDHISATWDVYMQDCSSAILYDLSVAFNSIA